MTGFFHVPMLGTIMKCILRNPVCSNMCLTVYNEQRRAAASSYALFCLFVCLFANLLVYLSVLSYNDHAWLVSHSITNVPSTRQDWLICFVVCFVLFVCFVWLLCFSCLVIFCICLFCLLGLQGRGSVQSSVQSDLSSVCKGASQNIGSLKHRQSAKQMSQQLGSCLAWQRLRQAC